jgi:hypothetical protein
MKEYFHISITRNENIIPDLDDNNLNRSPMKSVYYNNITLNSENLSKEFKDSDLLNSTNCNKFSISPNLSKISPIPKPDFSSIRKFENSLNYKQKAFQKKNKVKLHDSPIKSATKYPYNYPKDIKYCKESIIRKSACRKLNFFEKDESKEELKIKNYEELKTGKKDEDFSREIYLNCSFDQNSNQNLKISYYLINNQNNNLSFYLNDKTLFTSDFNKKENKSKSNLDLNFIKNNNNQNSNYSNHINECKALSEDLSFYNITTDFKSSMSIDNSFTNKNNFESPNSHKYHYGKENLNSMNKIKRKRNSNENSTIKEEKKVLKLKSENVKISEFRLGDEDLNYRKDDFSYTLNNKLSLNEIANSHNLIKNISFDKLREEISYIGNKKYIKDFWNLQSHSKEFDDIKD